jgi:hypothetical protein
MPTSKGALYTINEANEEGIPSKMPWLVMMVKYTAGTQFRAKFRIEAPIAFSLNPSRRPIFADAPKFVTFNGMTELIKLGEKKDPDFT